MAQNYVLAADLGGTNLRTAVVGGDGSVLYHRQIPTPGDGSAMEIAEALASEAQKCIGDINVEPLAFGVAAAALVDSGRRHIINAPNLHQLDGFPFADEIAKRLRIEIALENDATAAAIGEHWLGASTHVRSSICVTLGTGVGGGLILGGQPYRGASGTAGEIGHICVEPEGIDCGCGSRGCLEQYASATAIVRMATELVAENSRSMLHSSPDLTAKDVYNAGISGDEIALETFRRMGKYLGMALADLINVLNPEMIVVGGGAAAGWDLFIEHVRKEIRLRAFKHPADGVRIVRAELGNQAGILGAARVAFQSGPRPAASTESLS